MSSDRMRRQIDRLLDEAEEAISQRDWVTVGNRAQDVLRLDPDNIDAKGYLEAAERDPVKVADSLPPSSAAQDSAASTPSQATSFANG